MSDTSTKKGEDEFYLFIPVLRVFAQDGMISSKASMKKVEKISEEIQAEFGQLFAAIKSNVEENHPGIRIAYQIDVNQRYKGASNDSE